MSEVEVREIAPGVQITSAMTGAQILNAHLQAAGEKPLAIPHVTFSGPQGHPHTVVPDAASGTIAGRAPPPTPKQLEAANKPNANEVAEFDAQMRAAGKQLPLDRPNLAAGEFDGEAFDALTEQYLTLVRPLAGKTDAGSLATAARWKATYERDVKALYDGRQLNAEQLAKLRGAPGKVDTFVAKAQETAPAPTAQAPSWQQHIEDGQWVRLDRLTTADTSGYTIQRYVADQRMNVSAFDQLRDARAAGITQDQINAVFKQHAIRIGWVKA